MFKRLIAALVCLTFIFSNLPYAHAQAGPVTGGDFSINRLPVPGRMIGVSEIFTPVLVKGLVVHPDKPLNFDFIVDSGNDSVDQTVIKEQSIRIAKYFLAAVTVPENQLWVNLSPYEKARIIENDLGQTILGRDMLAQDYVLKQLAASLIYPEKGLGKDFWAKIYKEAQEKFGTTNIPVNTFNKVWIVPEKAVVFEKGNAVYVTQAKLKVMLESDYLAMSRDHTASAGLDVLKTDTKAVFAKNVIRQIILPAIEKEVNQGKNFATLRQVYYAAILAKWYRERVEDTLISKAYIGKDKISGISNSDRTIKERIYQRYISAYKKGVFNYIKEEYNAISKTMGPRKYFSGGLMDFAMKNVPLIRTNNPSGADRAIGKVFKVDFAMKSDHAPDAKIEQAMEFSNLGLAVKVGTNPMLEVQPGGDIFGAYDPQEEIYVRQAEQEVHKILDSLIGTDHGKRVLAGLDPHSFSVMSYAAKIYEMRYKTQAPAYLRLAGLLHDIDRAFPQREIKKKDYLKVLDEGKYYDRYKKAHSMVSAEIAVDILQKIGAPKALKTKVFRVIVNHEAGGQEDIDIIRDSDSVSYFEDENIEMVLKETLEGKRNPQGPEGALRKTGFMYFRASVEAKMLIEEIMNERKQRQSPARLDAETVALFEQIKNDQALRDEILASREEANYDYYISFKDVQTGHVFLLGVPKDIDGLTMDKIASAVRLQVGRLPSGAKLTDADFVNIFNRVVDQLSKPDAAMKTQPVVFSKLDKTLTVPPEYLTKLAVRMQIAKKLGVELHSDLYVKDGVVVGMSPSVNDDTRMALLTPFARDEKGVTETAGYYEFAYSNLWRVKTLAHEVYSLQQQMGQEDNLAKAKATLQNELNDYYLKAEDIATLNIYSLKHKTRYDLVKKQQPPLDELVSDMEWVHSMVTAWFGELMFFRDAPQVAYDYMIDIHNHPKDNPAPPSAIDPDIYLGDIYNSGFFEGKISGLILPTSQGDELFFLYEPNDASKAEYERLYNLYWYKNGDPKTDTTPSNAWDPQRRTYTRSVNEEQVLEGLRRLAMNSGEGPVLLDQAMNTRRPVIRDKATNGGIDIQNIDVTRKEGSFKIKFNDEAVGEVLKNGFSGFTPVIINITPIASPFQLLGINSAKEPEALAKV